MRTAGKTLIALAAVLAAAGCLLVRRQADPSPQLAETARRQKELATALFALYVDDCSGIAPDVDLMAPNRLTTPIAYTTAADMQDPFGRPGDRLLLMPQCYFTNTGSVAVISRGPDGHLESLDLPREYAIPRPLDLADGTIVDQYLLGERSVETWSRHYTPHVQRVLRYRDANGEWKDNDSIKVHRLPDFRPHASGSPEYKAAALAWFIENDAPPYDPTNGTVSRGDLIAIY